MASVSFVSPLLFRGCSRIVQRSARRHRLQNPFSSLVNNACPFKTLGVSKGEPYAAAKKAFLKLAMKYHPDTVSDDNADDDDVDSSSNQRSPVEMFHEIRSAFESLTENEDGVAVSRAKENDEDDVWGNEEFDSWFKAETGHNAPFMFDMDPETMREVAEATEAMDAGGLDRGGMWHLAKMVTQNVKDNDTSGGASLLRLDAGEEKPSRLSRRRRRPRS